MGRQLTRGVLTLASLLLPVLANACETGLPPPYSAQDIRGAWTLGFWNEMTTSTEAGEQTSRTTVTGWAEDSVTMQEQALNAGGDPVGEPAVYESSWSGLRDHACFAPDKAQRERHIRNTPFGRLVGWLYRVQGKPGEVQEFFFADRFPGAPLWFAMSSQGKTIMQAWQRARSDAELAD